MRQDEAADPPTICDLFSGGMILIGIYAAVRHVWEWAYAFGKLLGSS